MNALQVFKNQEFGEIRVLQSKDEIWLVAADVCRVLEIINPSDALKRLDDDEKARFNLGLSGGDTNMVNKAGFYALVLGSRKPEAKAFKRWVTHEILPTIEKTGGYVADDNLFVDSYFGHLDEHTQTFIKLSLQHMKSLNRQIEENRPKVLFADSVAASHTSILVGELAKIMKQNGIDIGQNRLFALLRQDGYLIKRQGVDYNMPTQKSMELGLFEIKETVINHADGHTSISKTPKLTGKGQCYFINRYVA